LFFFENKSGAKICRIVRQKRQLVIWQKLPSQIGSADPSVRPSGAIAFRRGVKKKRKGEKSCLRVF